MVPIEVINNKIHLGFGNIRFSNLYPVINDTHLYWVKPVVEAEKSTHFTLVYHIDQHEVDRLIVEITQHDDGIVLQYRLTGCNEPALIDTFGVCFEEVSGISTFLANGYHSWDSSKYHDTASVIGEKTIRSYAVTQLIPEDRSKVLTFGFDRHDRYQQYFVHAQREGHHCIQAISCWDRKNPGCLTLSSEKIIFCRTETVEEGLEIWAKFIAEKSFLKPRIPPKRVVGWCSWYNLYAAISEKNILENLAAVKKIRKQREIDLNVFLIDDGFTPEMGDWLEFKPQFPRGMKPIIKEIQQAGLTPGLWIAPFLVGNRSNLFQKYPEWVVKDAMTDLPHACMKFYGEFRWHKRSEEYYLLDITNPPAAQYLRNVLQIWHEDWGVDYFKTDFLYFAAENGPNKVTHHQPGLTRVEIFRKGCELIREAVGSAFLAGCGVPLWAGIGLFDSVRIGSDMGVDWVPADSPKSPLVSIPNRNYLNGILYQTDPDCVLLRDKFHNLTDLEINGLCTLAGLTGGTFMTSDNMDEIPATRMDLFQALARLDARPSKFINLGKPDDPLIIQVRFKPASEFPEHIFIMNSSDNILDVSIPLKRLGLNSGTLVFDVVSEKAFVLDRDEITAQLSPHEGRWFIVR
jgi:alpha-galactosidase